MFNVPSDWTFYSANGDSMTFQMSGHTVSAPRVVIFKRKTPTLGRNGEFSLSSYEVKGTIGHLDADGKPMRQRSHVTVSIDAPVGADRSVVKTLLSSLGGQLQDASFQDAALDSLLFPGPVADNA